MQAGRRCGDKDGCSVQCSLRRLDVPFLSLCSCQPGHRNSADQRVEGRFPAVSLRESVPRTAPLHTESLPEKERSGKPCEGMTSVLYPASAFLSIARSLASNNTGSQQVSTQSHLQKLSIRPIPLFVRCPDSEFISVIFRSLAGDPDDCRE
jgi:hypothetical protein